VLAAHFIEDFDDETNEPERDQERAESYAGCTRPVTVGPRQDTSDLA
jgi:hypothetical protein